MQPRPRHTPATPALRAIAVLVCALLAAPAAANIRGVVVDGEGSPIEGARACYLVQGSEQACAYTDDSGKYMLPVLPAETVRISLKGYLPVTISAVNRAEPVVLQLAASLLVVMVDAATKKPLAQGEMWMIYPSGRRKGPFPVRAAGVRVRTLEPAELRVSGEAAGYAPSKPKEVRLVGGEETRVEIAMTRSTGKD